MGQAAVRSEIKSDERGVVRKRVVAYACDAAAYIETAQRRAFEGVSAYYAYAVGYLYRSERSAAAEHAFGYCRKVAVEHCAGQLLAVREGIGAYLLDGGGDDDLYGARARKCGATYALYAVGNDYSLAVERGVVGVCVVADGSHALAHHYRIAFGLYGERGRNEHGIARFIGYHAAISRRYLLIVGAVRFERYACKRGAAAEEVGAYIFKLRRTVYHYALKRRAALEGVVAEGGQPCGKLDFGERRAACKGVRAERRERALERDALERSAVFERARTYRRQRGIVLRLGYGERHRPEVGHARKYPVAHIGAVVSYLLYRSAGEHICAEHGVYVEFYAGDVDAAVEHVHAAEAEVGEVERARKRGAAVEGKLVQRGDAAEVDVPELCAAVEGVGTDDEALRGHLGGGVGKELVPVICVLVGIVFYARIAVLAGVVPVHAFEIFAVGERAVRKGDER